MNDRCHHGVNKGGYDHEKMGWLCICLLIKIEAVNLFSMTPLFNGTLFVSGSKPPLVKSLVDSHHSERNVAKLNHVDC